ncbi:choice-of-anchor P family protein [Glycomyces buryatensis]|uniref:Big-1 domain-containing protein n=1 Tax=Glycomyces buryatensis TaxID=2570927 RepID=A0A4S8PTE4_9ACTN|nr:choice-of-anchor P family protein [Glycomyces buryatensis]THV34683.1 hypothetical protein FAB82_23835 [Glycomyces buryatensis]
MRRLAGKAVSVVAGGVLVLSLAVTAPEESPEADVAEWESAAVEQDDVDSQGTIACETEPGGEVFYPTNPEGSPSASASAEYNERFAQVGEDDDTLPFLRDLAPGGTSFWIPQGLAYWPDWDGQGKDLLLVGAYRDGYDSIIYGIDPETGKTIGTVKTTEGHLGGIVVLGDWAYVGSGQPTVSIRRYGLDQLRDGIKEGAQNGVPLEDMPSATYRDQDVEGSGWLGTDGETIYAGRYERSDDLLAPIMRQYEIGEGGVLVQIGNEYVVPLGTQGMAVVDGDYYFSVGPDHTTGGKQRSYLYRVDEEDMGENIYFGPPHGQLFKLASACFSAPSMSEGIGRNGDEVYLAFESGTQEYADGDAANEVEHIHVGQLGSDGDDDDGDDGDLPGSTTSYTGPTEADFHDEFTASARLTDGDGPVSGERVDFELGSGGGSQSCGATTDAEGVAACALTPTQRPGQTTLTASFGGSSDLASSQDTVSFTVSKQETALRYTGPERVANGTPTELSGILTEETHDGPPVADRSVTLALGEGDDRQSCDAVTNGDGEAACEIESVDQPLNEEATVPVNLSFDGDDYYESSSVDDTVLLEYYTGRAFGLSAEVDLLDLGAGLEPTPDTGPIRTADATENDPGCVADVSTLVISAESVCPQVTTSLAPGTSTSTTSVQNAEIGLPGLPVIEIEGATARSTSTCDAGGSADGATDLTLRVGGDAVEITGEANATVDLGGAAKLVVNEQEPVSGADHGLTVNAVHLTAADGAVDIVIASATSDVHNCVE